MTEQSTHKTIAGIDVFKIVAGSLAAVSSAVCASFLGVAGTLIGAAVASLISAIGQELYQRSLSHGYHRLRGLTLGPDPAGQPREPVATGALGRAAAQPRDPARARPAAAQRPSTADPAPLSLPHRQPASARSGALSGRPTWARIALLAVAVFVLAMGALTAVELIVGRSVAGLLGDDAAGATTIGTVAPGGHEQPARPAPGPTSTDGRNRPGAPAPTSTDANAPGDPRPTAPEPAPSGGDTGPAPTDPPAAPTDSAPLLERTPSGDGPTLGP
jgi:hypothetical protein